MPAVQTQGFSVQNMPQVQFADPRLIAPAYSNIIPSVNQGLGTYANLQQIADAAVARPIKRQMAQIQLQQAQNQMQLMPLATRRKLIELSQPIEHPVTAGIESVNRFPQVQEMGDDGQMITSQPAGQDIFATETVEEIDPNTGEKRLVTRRTKPTQTMEQGVAASDLADYRDQLAAIRLQQATTQQEAAQAKAENDRIKAEAARDKAAFLQANPAVGFVDVKKSDGRTYRQYFPKANPSQIIHEVDRGVLASDILNFGGGVINVTPGQPTTIAAPSGLDPDIANLAKSLGGTPSLSMANKANVAKDQFVVGKVYTDGSGNRATYLGNGQWQDAP